MAAHTPDSNGTEHSALNGTKETQVHVPAGLSQSTRELLRLKGADIAKRLLACEENRIQNGAEPSPWEDIL